jgi:Sortase domain
VPGTGRTGRRHGRRNTARAAAAALGITGALCLAVATARQGPPPPPLTRIVPSSAAAPAAVVRDEPSGPVMPASPPVALAIPAIGVRTPLLTLGLTPQGTLETPAVGPHYDQAGWYRYSPTPGSLGPAVLAGHVDSAAHGPSVFYRLADLRPRDRVSISRADGSVAVFAVDEVLRLRKTSFPSQLVYGDTDHAALRLITCGGRFDRASGHYVDNIVVLASLVDTSRTGTRRAARTD